MKLKWKGMPVSQKIVLISGMIICAAITLLAILQISGIWRNAGYLYLPLLGINMLLQAFLQWKTNRSLAVFSLCTALFVIVCAGVVWALD